MLLEITTRKINPHKADRKIHLIALGKNLDLQTSKYENFIIMGDFNAEPSETAVSDFMDIYNLKNLLKHPTCFIRRFGKIVKPFISNKRRSSENITLVKGDDAISDKSQVGSILNEFLVMS